MSNPSGYQFDGQTWSSRPDSYTVVDQLLFSRRSSKRNTPQIGPISSSDFSNRPFLTRTLLPQNLYPSNPSYDNGHLITSDPNGMIWLYSSNQDLYNLSDETLSINDGIDDPDPKQSAVLGFGTKVIYFQDGKYPADIQRFLPESLQYYYDDMPFTVDAQGRIWFYHPDKGLVLVDHGSANLLGRIPEDPTLIKPGGVLPLQSGEIWIGGDGVIWELKKDQWRKMVVEYTDHRFTNFAQDNQGLVYGATGEGVYQFRGSTYTATLFVQQSFKPLIIPDDGKLLEFGKCSYHKQYAVAGNCPALLGKASSEYKYQVRYLGVQDDGTVIYVNNRIIAKFKGGQWKSFAFDTFSIDSATVDKDGNIWIFSNSEGLFMFAANIFDEYQILIRPSAN
jgi:hypothetical protein